LFDLTKVKKEVSAMQQSIYVGLDLGSNCWYQTVINQEDGTLLSSRVISTSEQHLRSAFTDFGQ